MTGRTGAFRSSRVLVGVLLLAASAAAAWWFLEDRGTWPRGEALGSALRPLVEGKDPERALVARAIWENYLETRANASRWSGVYWGFTFTAAAMSAACNVRNVSACICVRELRTFGCAPRCSGGRGQVFSLRWP